MPPPSHDSIDRPLPLAKRLIAMPSVSDRPNGPAADICEGYLVHLGAVVERSVYRDAVGVEKTNLVARFGPDPTPAALGFAWFGHTDVVPADRWEAPGGPFDPAVEGGRLFGRAGCDMKGPIACVLAAAARIRADPAAKLTAPLWVVLTADEEVGFVGARRLVEDSPAYAALRAVDPPGVVGEPTGLRVVHAHKGARRLTITSRGTAAHSSTDRGVNANLGLLPFLADLPPLIRESRTHPALRNPEFDPPGLSWNLTLSDGACPANVTPAVSCVRIAARPVPGVDDTDLVERFLALARRHGLEATDERLSDGFLTDPDAAFPTAVRRLVGQRAPVTVCYGTDAGAFASARGGLSNLIVFGPGDIAQAHTSAEFVDLAQLDRGCDLYERLFRDRCVG